MYVSMVCYLAFSQTNFVCGLLSIGTALKFQVAELLLVSVPSIIVVQKYETAWT